MKELNKSLCWECEKPLPDKPMYLREDKAKLCKKCYENHNSNTNK